MGKHVKKQPYIPYFDFRVDKYICYDCKETIDPKLSDPQQPVRASPYSVEAGMDKRIYHLHNNCIDACVAKWRRENRENESKASGSGNNALRSA